MSNINNHNSHVRKNHPDYMLSRDKNQNKYWKKRETYTDANWVRSNDDVHTLRNSFKLDPDYHNDGYMRQEYVTTPLANTAMVTPHDNTEEEQREPQGVLEYNLTAKQKVLIAVAVVAAVVAFIGFLSYKLVT